MADAVTVKLTGFKELADKLRAMGREIGEKALKGAVAGAAGLVRDEARRLVPQKTGTLRRSIYMVFDKERSTASKKVYVVGWRKGKRFRSVGKNKVNLDGYYGLFVEFGTAKMAARPFVRPAFEKKKDAALDIIGKRIAARIKRFEKKGR